MSITSDLFNQQAEVLKRLEKATAAEVHLLRRLCMQEHMSLHRLLVVVGGGRLAPTRLDLRRLIAKVTDDQGSVFVNYFRASRAMVLVIAEMTDNGQLSAPLARKVRLALTEIASHTDALLSKLSMKAKAAKK